MKNAGMTLTELRYIVAVARERHFGRAAEACFVSQPTLSVAVKKLEDELDTKIFERGGNEVGVTPLGEEIVRQAQAVIEQACRRIHPALRRVRLQPLRLRILQAVVDAAPIHPGRAVGFGHAQLGQSNPFF